PVAVGLVPLALEERDAHRVGVLGIGLGELRQPVLGRLLEVRALLGLVQVAVGVDRAPQRVGCLGAGGVEVGGGVVGDAGLHVAAFARVGLTVELEGRGTDVGLLRRALRLLARQRAGGVGACVLALADERPGDLQLDVRAAARDAGPATGRGGGED